MTTTQKPWIAFPPDWTWISVGFCYFVIGHLFPISILFTLGAGEGWLNAISGIWAFGGLAVIAFIIGYRSVNIAVLEAVIACMIYTFILNVGVSSYWTGTLKLSGEFWMLMAFVTSTISATMGELVQNMKTAKG